jgi:uncharacterized membrane protein YqjE
MRCLGRIVTFLAWAWMYFAVAVVFTLVVMLVEAFCTDYRARLISASIVFLLLTGASAAWLARRGKL